MKTLIYTATVFTLFGLAASCKKGDNTKLDDHNEPVSEFMSTKEGSWWTYGSNEGTVTTRRATGRDSLKLERIYNYYETTDTSSKFVTPEYFAKNQDLYIMLVDMDGSQSKYINVVVQKDSAQVGDTWTNTGTVNYSGLPVQVLIEGTVTETDGNMTINGNNFTDVVTISNKLKAKVIAMPTYVNCGTVTMSFKKGVGIIKSDFDINILSYYSRRYTDSLLQYHIVP